MKIHIYKTSASYKTRSSVWEGGGRGGGGAE